MLIVLLGNCEEDSSTNLGSDESLNVQSSFEKDPTQTTRLFDVNVDIKYLS